VSLIKIPIPIIYKYELICRLYIGYAGSSNLEAALIDMVADGVEEVVSKTLELWSRKVGSEERVMSELV